MEIINEISEVKRRRRREKRREVILIPVGVPGTLIEIVYIKDLRLRITIRIIIALQYVCTLE